MSIITAAESRTQGEAYKTAICAALPGAAAESHLCGNDLIKVKGKVRDVYVKDKEVIMISTDRLSAFDRHLACVPLKGRVLSLVSSWWFRRITEAGITKHHLLRTPHPNVAIVRRCTVFPVEFVVRGYMTVRWPTPSLSTVPFTLTQSPIDALCIVVSAGFHVHLDLAQLQPRHASVLRARSARWHPAQRAAHYRDCHAHNQGRARRAY